MVKYGSEHRISFKSKLLTKNMYTQFHEASNIMLEPHGANIYFYFIERSVNKAIIQHQRIQHDKLNHSQSTPLQSIETGTVMLADIHYYLVN